jgi:hypothetical protein
MIHEKAPFAPSEVILVETSGPQTGKPQTVVSNRGNIISGSTTADIDSKRKLMIVVGYVVFTSSPHLF